MNHHLFCLTIDTDPDGLSGKSTNRRTLSWEGLAKAQALPQYLQDFDDSLAPAIPMTWFIRADSQLRQAFGTPLYLLDKFQNFWDHLKKSGHELGWHPHLYGQVAPEYDPVLITDPLEACDELERLWAELKTSSFQPTVFRNGEGWHCPQTFSTIERFQFICDSTAIPERCGGSNHPMNWMGTPNQPYFPDRDDIRVPGTERSLLEMPMNTWLVQTPYDSAPKIRYMNPAIHESLFDNALDRWETVNKNADRNLSVWVLIFHPDEVMPTPTQDLLYAHSIKALCRNLQALTMRLQRTGESFEFVTLSPAALRWKQSRIVPS